MVTGLLHVPHLPENITALKYQKKSFEDQMLKCRLMQICASPEDWKKLSGHTIYLGMDYHDLKAYKFEIVTMKIVKTVE